MQPARREAAWRQPRRTIGALPPDGTGDLVPHAPADRRAAVSARGQAAAPDHGGNVHLRRTPPRGGDVAALGGRGPAEGRGRVAADPGQDRGRGVLAAEDEEESRGADQQGVAGVSRSVYAVKHGIGLVLSESAGDAVGCG